jgi:hypothetical protein
MRLLVWSQAEKRTATSLTCGVFVGFAGAVLLPTLGTYFHAENYDFITSSTQIISVSRLRNRCVKSNKSQISTVAKISARSRRSIDTVIIV